MNKTSRTSIRVAILGVLLIALVFALYTSFVKDPNQVKAGHEAPNFRLQQLNGSVMKLSDLKGKAVVLNFWGTWCEPCKAEMPALQKQYDTHKEKGLVVIGVNIGETPVAIQSFVDQYGVSFPILLDRDLQITKLYRIGPIPTTFFIDRDGEIEEIFVGQMTDTIISQKVAQILK
jgi:peroxiredoxin